MCLDCELSVALEIEARRRTSVDGIPRRVTPEGKIMKLDWVMSDEGIEVLESETLEEHIASLLAQQMGPEDPEMFIGWDPS